MAGPADGLPGEPPPPPELPEMAESPSPCHTPTATTPIAAAADSGMSHCLLGRCFAVPAEAVCRSTPVASVIAEGSMGVAGVGGDVT